MGSTRDCIHPTRPAQKGSQTSNHDDNKGNPPPLPPHSHTQCYDKDLQTIFIYFTRCIDTGVTVTHALSFYRPLAPLFLLIHAQLAVVTQSCALLYTAAHCDLLFSYSI